MGANHKSGRMLLVFLLLFAAAAADVPRLGICVTGRLGRLEYWSKLHNLIEPNMHDYQIDLLFVLDFGEGGFERYTTKYAAAVTGVDLFNVTLQACPHCRVQVEVNEQPRSPTLAKPHLTDMNKTRVIDAETLRQKNTVHARLFHSWTRCFHRFSHDPLVTYDAFVRIRDDQFIAKPIFITEDMWKGVVSVKDNCGWPGCNDKIAVLDARFGYQYFSGPLANLYMNYAEMRDRAFLSTPEAVLRASLAFDRVPVQVLSAEELPIISTQRRGRQEFCLLNRPPKSGSATSCVPDSLIPLLQVYQCSKQENLRDTNEFWQAHFLGGQRRQQAQRRVFR